MTLDAVEHATRRDLGRPARHHGHPDAPLIGGHLLAAKRRGGAIRPGGVFRTVVGGIDDDGVLFQPPFFQLVEQIADVAVVLHHAAAMVVVFAGVLLGCVAPLVVETGIEVHAAGVDPGEEGLVFLDRAVDELEGGRDHLGAVELLHPLLTQRAGIGALLFADFAETRVNRLVFGLGGIAVQDAAGTELLAVRLERA